MEEKDLQRIERMIGKTVRAEVEKVVKTEVSGFKDEMKAMRADVGSFQEEIRSDIGSFKEEIKNDFRVQAGILSEDFQHKLQLVSEGHQMLSEKIDKMRDEINNKIDAVSADLSAHRTDTEGHKRGYMVKEP